MINGRQSETQNKEFTSEAQLCCLLVKAGYAVRIGKERPGGKGQTMYFVEYWVEGDDTNAETGN